MSPSASLRSRSTRRTPRACSPERPAEACGRPGTTAESIPRGDALPTLTVGRARLRSGDAERRLPRQRGRRLLRGPRTGRLPFDQRRDDMDARRRRPFIGAGFHALVVDPSTTAPSTRPRRSASTPRRRRHDLDAATVRAGLERLGASQRRRHRGARDDAGGPRPLDRPRGHLERRRPHRRAEPAELSRLSVGHAPSNGGVAWAWGASDPPMPLGMGTQPTPRLWRRATATGAFAAIAATPRCAPGSPGTTGTSRRPHLRRIRVRRRDQSLPRRSAGPHLGVDNL